MGLFTKIIKMIETEMKRHYEEMTKIVQDLDKLRAIVKDSPREKLDDLQRQINKLYNEMER